MITYKNYRIRREDDRNLVLEHFRTIQKVVKEDGKKTKIYGEKEWAFLGYYSHIEHALRELCGRIAEGGKTFAEAMALVKEFKISIT